MKHFDNRPLKPNVITGVQIARILFKVGFVEYRQLDLKNPEVRITDDGLEALNLLKKLVGDSVQK